MPLMRNKTGTRLRPQPGGQRRQHSTQISISDDNHHVTDAISSLYDYGEQQPGPPRNNGPPNPHTGSQHQRPRVPRPLSFLPSTKEEISHSLSEEQEDARKETNTKPLSRAKTLEGGIRNFERPSHHTNRQYVVGRSISAPHEPALSPHLRSPADTATSSFPLNDIDYESSPAAVAQELSNLQAIRRMSMNVDAAGDPDLPAFAVHSMQSTDNDADSEDPSRLFWVPASVHPELAPKEFKTFIDSRVDSLKRRSGEFTAPADGPPRSTSNSALQRKKSMLSRQIDNSDGRGADGYQDGAERLERKRSSATPETLAAQSNMNLHELEVLVNDPSKGMSKLSMESQQDDHSQLDEDMPILPLAPGGNTLKRSTRTTYRRSSMREGKRVPPSRRAATKSQADESSESSPPLPSNEMPGLGLNRVQTEPPLSMDRQVQDKTAENFSRPSRSTRRLGSPTSPPSALSFDQSPNQQPRSPPDPSERKSPPLSSPMQPTSPIPPSPTAQSREPRPFVSQIASNGRTTARVPAANDPTQISEAQRSQSQQDYRPPERVSSHQPISLSQSQTPGGAQMPPPPARSSKRHPSPRQGQQNEQSNQTLQHMAAHPSPLPGNSTRTDSLSFIPTLTEDKRADAQKEVAKKSGWGAIGSWLGGDEKERQRRKEEETREAEKAKRY